MLKSLLYHSTLQLDRALTHFPTVGRFKPLRGSFSAFERLLSGALDGKVLADCQTPGPCPPGSITERAGMSQHDHQPWPVFWVRTDDARLIGSMLHWRDPDDLLCREAVFHMTQRRRLGEDRYLAQIVLPPPLHLPGAWTSLASNWGDGRNYFHWISDGLTRLMVREHLPEETRILLPGNTPSYLLETIEMLELSSLTQTVSSPVVQPERFYFCSPTSMTGVWNPLGFNWLRRKFSRFHSAPASGEPIFLTRRGGTRVPANLQRLENRFASNGFKIIDCAGLTVKEQIRLTSAAPAIAGIHGAAMTNILWAPPQTPILELFQSSYLNACYEQIALQGDLRYEGLVLDETGHERVLNDWLRNHAATQN